MPATWTMCCGLPGGWPARLPEVPLRDPPPPSVLAGLPEFALAGLVLHRVHRRTRPDPWWFASVPADADAEPGGRFDLPAPRGACYLATSPAAAVLESLQDFGAGLLPEAELRARVRSAVTAPRSAPVAAHLTARSARGRGVTAALWAGAPRPLTQRWAATLDRAGWLALRCGVQHDPTGRLRSVVLFDDAGAHPPYDEQGWTVQRHALHGDPAARVALATHGITVTVDPDLPVVALPDSGLL